MKVLIVKPNEEPKLTEIDGSLKSMQDIVGGYIQAFYPFDDNVVFVCNEEGKILNLPPNREIRDKDGQITDIVCGVFFIAGVGEEDFVSLNEEQTIKYTKKFGMSDSIKQEESQAKDVVDKESLSTVNTTTAKTLTGIRRNKER